jgi:alpha-amylase
MGWVFLAARQHGTPLFYSRPAGSTRENYWGNNRVGERGNDEFKHPEVVAANNYRHAMSGEAETVAVTDNGAVIAVARGNKGVAIINISNDAQDFELASNLADGTYNDKVHNATFTVANGKISGQVAPLTSYIIY